MPPARIRTERLLIRRYVPEDAPLLKDAIDSSLDHLRAWMPWAIAEPSELPALEARLARFHEDFIAGRDFVFGIFDPADRTLLGGIGLHARIGPGALEIGYWLRQSETGRGYITEAARAITNAAFAMPDIERIEIHCDPENTRSAAVPRRLGYRHAETRIGDARGPEGEPRNSMIWVVTAAEWGEVARASAGASPQRGSRHGIHR